MSTPASPPNRRRTAAKTREKLAREHEAREAAEALEVRARFLAEATRILLSSFDYDTTLARFARLAVPLLGDFCVIDVRDGDDVQRVATAHADPARESLIRNLARFPPTVSAAANPIRRVLASGHTVVAGPSELVPGSIAIDPEHRALLERLAPRAGVFAPILGPTGTLGVVSFLATDDRVYRPDDIALAEDLANRAALAIGNAQLFHQAQQATRARDEILSVVAHDLRNPMGVVRNATELILDMGPDERIRPLLAMIRRSTETMDRLIGDLLEVTRMESRGLSLALTDREVGSLVSEAVEMLRSLADAAGIELRVEIGAEGLVRVDGIRILQVFSNLVGNAIKFTPRGGSVTISASDAGAEFRFAIADTGPGIPPEQLPHVFGRFWQADTSDRRGLGLGLAIAKGLVEAHGGHIWLESTPGAGTTVSFTLPKPGDQLAAVASCGGRVEAAAG
jgi:signal transduction histidine kinase